MITLLCILMEEEFSVNCVCVGGWGRPVSEKCADLSRKLLTGSLMAGYSVVGVKSRDRVVRRLDWLKWRWSV